MAVTGMQAWQMAMHVSEIEMHDGARGGWSGPSGTYGPMHIATRCGVEASTCDLLLGMQVGTTNPSRDSSL